MIYQYLSIFVSYVAVCSVGMSKDAVSHEQYQNSLHELMASGCKSGLSMGGTASADAVGWKKSRNILFISLYKATVADTPSIR